jgi:hypothetical protein
LWAGEEELLRIPRPFSFGMLFVALALVGAALPPAARAVAQSVLTFPVLDDATIMKDQPATNVGAASSLETDNTPVKHFLLKFRVTGSGNAIQSAIVRLRNVDPSGRGGDFFPATNGWEEETVTWQTAPGIPEATWPNASLGAVSVGNTFSVDVTSFVLGDGTYSMRVSSPSSDGADYSSKEGSIRPVLVVTTSANQIVMAAGDIACDPSDGSFNSGNGTALVCAQKRTGALLTGRGRVLALGDTQYDNGDVNGTTNDEPDYLKYLSSYHQSWGRYKTKTHPAWGNHEYLENGISTNPNVGYRRYFRYVLNLYGAAAGDPTRGYYRVNLGAGWVGFALNTNCDNGSVTRHADEAVACWVGSAQYVWLRDQLRTLGPGTCELTWGHHPLWTSSSGSRNKSALLRPLYTLMYDEGVELALVGHAHNYEVFHPQNPYDNSRNDARGVRQVVVGTGGRGLYAFDAPLPNVLARQNHTFGVARLTLRAGSYEGDFVPEASKTWDDPTWSGTCH